MSMLDVKERAVRTKEFTVALLEKRIIGNKIEDAMLKDLEKCGNVLEGIIDIASVDKDVKEALVYIKNELENMKLEVVKKKVNQDEILNAVQDGFDALQDDCDVLQDKFDALIKSLRN